MIQKTEFKEEVCWYTNMYIVHEANYFWSICFFCSSRECLNNRPFCSSKECLITDTFCSSKECLATDTFVLQGSVWQPTLLFFTGVSVNWPPFVFLRECLITDPLFFKGVSNNRPFCCSRECIITDPFVLQGSVRQPTLLFLMGVSVNWPLFVLQGSV